MTKSSTVPDNYELKISMYWGDILYDTAICTPKSPITIGRGESNTFILDPQLENERDESFRLVELTGDNHAELYFSEHYNGHLKLDGKMISFATAKKSNVVQRAPTGDYSIKLSQRDNADVTVGLVSFYLDWVKPSEKIPHAPLMNKREALIFLALLLLTWGAVYWLAGNEIPPEEKPPERLVRLETQRPRATSSAPSNADASKAAIGDYKTKDGGAAKGDLGKATTHLANTTSAVSSLRKANLGSLVSGLTKLGANSPQVADTRGTVAAVRQEGTGGFSTEGLKKGGGGKSEGLGRTQGQGEGGFSGTGRLGLYGNSSVDGTGSGGGGSPVRVAGGLDRDVIESIIRRRLDRIRLCYERQLNFFPKLAGKVAVHFVIGKKGEVVESNVLEDTMKNASVRSCILFEVKSWTFPAPEGGTLVNVDYPFVFESSAKK